MAVDWHARCKNCMWGAVGDSDDIVMNRSRDHVAQDPTHRVEVSTMEITIITEVRIDSEEAENAFKTS